MIPVSVSEIRSRLKVGNITYRDVENRSRGVIRVSDLKNVLNGITCKMAESKLKTLALILACPVETLIQPGFLRVSNAPFGVPLLLQGLYTRKAKDVQPFYAAYFVDRKKSLGLQNLLRMSASLHLVMTSVDDHPDLSVQVSEALSRISEFAESSMSLATDLGVPIEEFSCLLLQIQTFATQPIAQQTMLLFTFCVLLFDAIFVEEMVASALQISMDRLSPTVMQYHTISIDLERRKHVLLSFLIHQEANFDTEQAVIFGIHESLFDESVLLVCACEQCRDHLSGDFWASEYVNRATMAAIVSRVSKMLDNLGITLEGTSLIDHTNSRFSRRLERFRSERARFRDSERELLRQLAHEREMEALHVRAELAEKRLQAEHQRQLENKENEQLFRLLVILANAHA